MSHDDVVVNITVGGAALSAFSSGVPLFVAEHTVTANRQDGPFSSLQELVDLGFTTASNSYLWAQALISQRPRPQNFLIGRRAVAESMADAMVAILAAGEGSWYQTHTESRAIADLIELADFTEPLLKTALVQSSDQDMLDDTGGNDAETLNAGGYDRTALVYHPDDSEFLDGAWGGHSLGYDLENVQGPWSHRQLKAISGTNLSTAEKTALESNEANFYAPKAMSSGQVIDPYTFEGVMASGRFIEQQISIDWTQARLEEALHGVLLRHPSGVPFDDAGFALFEAAAQNVFARGLGIGHHVARTSDVTGRRTPYLDVVGLDDVSSGDDADARVRMSGELHIGKKARRVVLNVVANL